MTTTLLRPCLKLSMVISLPALFVLAAGGAEQWVSVGDHRLYLHCSGRESGPTVVLETGAGGSSSDWVKVQNLVEHFSRVCSYDRAGLGKSDKPTHRLTESMVVDDLHQLLVNSHQPGPYLLVGHSLGGIYVRAFASAHPTLVKGLVLVDSSHEEQLNRYTAISPELGQQFANQQGRSSYEDAYNLWGQLHPGETLTWHSEIPLIVIEHRRPADLTTPSAGQPNDEGHQVAVAWHDMQVDLAYRSPRSRLREAQGGHMIPQDEPDLVSQAVADVLAEMKTHPGLPR